MKKAILGLIVLIALSIVAWYVVPMDRLMSMGASSSSYYYSSNAPSSTSSQYSSSVSSSRPNTSSRSSHASSKRKRKRNKPSCTNPTSQQVIESISVTGQGGIGSVALQDATIKANAKCEQMKGKASCDKGCTKAALGGALPFGAPKYKGKEPNVSVKQEFKCTLRITCS